MNDNKCIVLYAIVSFLNTCTVFDALGIVVSVADLEIVVFYHCISCVSYTLFTGV